MLKKAIAVIISTSMLSTFTVLAEPAKSAKSAKQAIAVTQYRQAVLKLLKSNVGALGAMNKGAIPFNVETIQTNSLRLKQLSLMLTDYFDTDTTGFDVDTAALDNIWENKADFKDKIDALTAAAIHLNTVATADDTNQFKQAIGQVFKSCKGCHDNYKKD